MKFILKLEELLLLVLFSYAFLYLGFTWWWGLLFLLTPDIGMIGYLFNVRVGSISYNIFHFKGTGVVLLLLGLVLSLSSLQFVGLIILAHACLDRCLGYGLKYSSSFKDTHLGKI